jgi:hypothetical protein
MSKDDNRQELGRLINEHLVAEGLRPADITKKLPESQKRSFFNWKSGAMPPRSNDARVALEDALGWKRGAVTMILEAPITQTFELSELRDWGQVTDPPVARASELSTDELLTELTRRVLDMDQRLSEFEGDDAQVIRLHGSVHEGRKPTRRAMDLAANSTKAGRNTEHLEKDGDED